MHVDFKPDKIYRICKTEDDFFEFYATVYGKEITERQSTLMGSKNVILDSHPEPRRTVHFKCIVHTLQEIMSMNFSDCDIDYNRYTDENPYINELIDPTPKKITYNTLLTKLIYGYPLRIRGLIIANDQFERLDGKPSDESCIVIRIIAVDFFKIKEG